MYESNRSPVGSPSSCLAAFILVAGALCSTASRAELNVFVQPSGVTMTDLAAVLADGSIDASEATTLAAKAISAALSRVVEEGQICREATAQWALHNKTQGSITITYTVTVVPPPGETGKNMSYTASALVSATPGAKNLAVGVYRPGSQAFAKVYRCNLRG